PGVSPRAPSRSSTRSPVPAPRLPAGRLRSPLHRWPSPAIGSAASSPQRRPPSTSSGSLTSGFSPASRTRLRSSFAASHTPGVLEIEVADGDITALDVDAIANAANDRLWMGAGVPGAIKRAGGDEIEQEAVAKGPIPLGSAIATGAGRLSARYVIHGAVMGQDLRTNADLIERTTRSCLELADELGCQSLALPAFGTGVGGFSLDECAQIMVAAARASEPAKLRRLVFAVFGA